MGFLQVRQKKHSHGKEICYECDICGEPFIRNYRDKAILKTVGRDRIQNRWFEANNLNLVRITDKQFNLHKKGIVEYL